MKLTAPKGTKDILPSEIASWEKIEKTAKALCSQYGFKQIRTPEFEYTDLFVRGVGEGTDIVKKEMYTFARNEKNSFTLKPERYVQRAAACETFLSHELLQSRKSSKGQNETVPPVWLRTYRLRLSLGRRSGDNPCRCFHKENGCGKCEAAHKHRGLP